MDINGVNGKVDITIFMIVGFIAGLFVLECTDIMNCVVTESSFCSSDLNLTYFTAKSALCRL